MLDRVDVARREIIDAATPEAQERVLPNLTEIYRFIGENTKDTLVASASQLQVEITEAHQMRANAEVLLHMVKKMTDPEMSSDLYKTATKQREEAEKLLEELRKRLKEPSPTA